MSDKVQLQAFLHPAILRSSHPPFPSQSIYLFRLTYHLALFSCSCWQLPCFFLLSTLLVTTSIIAQFEFVAALWQVNTAPNQPPDPSIKALLSCIKHRSDPRFCPSGQKAASNDTTKPPVTRAGSDWRRVCFLAWKMVSTWQECMYQCSLLAQPVPLNKSPEKNPLLSSSEFQFQRGISNL